MTTMSKSQVETQLNVENPNPNGVNNKFETIKSNGESYSECEVKNAKNNTDYAKSNSSSLPTGVLITNGSRSMNSNNETTVPSESTAENKTNGLRCFFNFIVYEIKWMSVIFELSLALGFFYIAPISIYRFFAEFWTPSWWVMVATWTWAFTLTTCGGIGLSVGAHRLWSHHAFKAKWPLKLMLTLMYTMAAEDSVYHYVKHHRAHHKYLDTNGDPQNIKRGFWYAQAGYRILKLHPEYREKVKNISYTDMHQDPFVMFQHKYYVPLVILVAFAFPVSVPVFIWNETLLNSFLIAGCSKSFLVIHMHGLVGSICHTVGKRPYNKRISAADNGFMQIITAGEAYHNFHHTFPYDYSISELGKTFNTSKIFIDIMAWLGLAYDLRLAGEEFIKKTKLKAAEENPICYTWI
ncbi:stearoyl-CoA desaturase 5-like [Tetranychus urticae]|uniref:stearoyl-CoA desaturase 5-like n=1 Tax=Tetranychus urticae TaxID=32264 RepID=UPI00077BC1EC|nr:stearoyl-CoA desaturase 5-like [Tetranychus urticae]